MNVHERFDQANLELSVARGNYVESRGADRVQAETALRVAAESELLALCELLDQIEELEELEEA